MNVSRPLKHLNFKSVNLLCIPVFISHNHSVTLVLKSQLLYVATDASWVHIPANHNQILELFRTRKLSPYKLNLVCSWNYLSGVSNKPSSVPSFYPIILKLAKKFGWYYRYYRILNSAKNQFIVNGIKYLPKNLKYIFMRVNDLIFFYLENALMNGSIIISKYLHYFIVDISCKFIFRYNKQCHLFLISQKK